MMQAVGSGGLCSDDFDQARALFEFADDRVETGLQPVSQNCVGCVAQSQPDNRRRGAVERGQRREVFVFRHDGQPALPSEFDD